MNAIWKVSHEWAAGPRASTSARAASRPSDGACARSAATWVAIRCWAMTSFMNRKQRSASASEPRNCQARSKLVRHRRGLGDRVQRLVAQVLGEPLGDLALGGQPLGIPADDGGQPGGDGLGVGLREDEHVEQGPGDLDRLGERRLDGRQPGREHPGGAAGPGRDVPVDRAGAPDGELQPVAVLQPQPAQLVVDLVVRVAQVVAHRQEHVRAAALHRQGGLVEPRVDRDLPRGLPVVAQRRLDEPLPAAGSSWTSTRSTTSSCSGYSPVVPGRARQRHRHRDIHGGAPEPADRPPGLGDLAGALRLVAAPRRTHRHRVEVGRHLEAQAHRRRHHQAALGRAVLGGVLVGVHGRVVDGGDGHAGALPCARSSPTSASSSSGSAVRGASRLRVSRTGASRPTR